MPGKLDELPFQSKPWLFGICTIYVHVRRDCEAASCLYQQMSPVPLKPGNTPIPLLYSNWFYIVPMLQAGEHLDLSRSHENSSTQHRRAGRSFLDELKNHKAPRHETTINRKSSITRAQLSNFITGEPLRSRAFRGVPWDFADFS